MFFFLLMAFANPLLVHNGETVLFFMNDNPVTLEAMIYGGMSSLMIVGDSAYGAVATARS